MIGSPAQTLLSSRGYGVSAEDVERYFSDKLNAIVRIEKFKHTFPGISRETYLLKVDVGGEKKGFVLRIDPPAGGGCPYELEREYEVYKRLWRSPIPVAEPLWFDKDIDFAQGRAHMVRDLVEGSTSIPGLSDKTETGAKLRLQIVRDHIEHLAEIHTLDWKAFGFDQFMDVPDDPTDALRKEFAFWKAYWMKNRTHAAPLMTEVLYWLEENIPTDNPMISLIKGNNGVGEEIYRDNKVVAMSDWELACLADGTLDLGFSQGSLSMDNFSEAIKYYGECVGHEVSPQRLAFGIFWIMFKVVVSLDAIFLKRHLENHDDRIVSASLGILNVNQKKQGLYRSVGKDIVSALMDLSVDKTKSTYADIGATK